MFPASPRPVGHRRSARPRTNAFEATLTYALDETLSLKVLQHLVPIPNRVLGKSCDGDKRPLRTLFNHLDFFVARERIVVIFSAVDLVVRFGVE